MSNSPSFALVLAALSWAATASAADQLSPGRVTNVTLYRGQAQITREVPVEGASGSLEVIASNLPEQVDPSSLFAEGSEQVDVRAVRYRERPVGEEPREEVRQLESEVAATEQKIALNQKNTELIAKQVAYLDGLEGFVAPTAKTELSRGVLDAEALQKITEFSFSQRKEIAEREVQLADELRKLQSQLETLQRQLAAITRGSVRSVREAVLFLEKRAEGSHMVRLSYLVNNCGWSPSYTIRAADGQPQVRLEYNALIQQVSGEDWQDVSLTLSTAYPALSAAGPGLAPFRVALASPDPAQQKKAQQQIDVSSQLATIYGRQQAAVVQNRNSFRFRENFDTAWDINGAANELQCLELVTDARLLNDLQQVSQPGDGPSLSYTLNAPVSLSSRTDQQIVRISQDDLGSHFYHVATPVLSDYVYREAEVNNDSDYDLLGGTVNVYLNGRFVGRTELPTVARGQLFVVGFGADAQLRARRELASRTDEVQGGNRELSFTYRLELENYKAQPAEIRLMDRLPASASDGEIRVTLTESGQPLSEDPIYQRLERSKGLLRWDVEVPAGAGGETAQVVQYQYTVEYDRQYELTAANIALEQQQQEFQQLIEQRRKR